MPAPLSDAEREKFVKLCGMLGSAFAGERDNAVVKVNEFLKEHNMTWLDVIVPPPEPQLPAVTVTVGDQPEPEADDVTGWRLAVLYMLQRRPDLLRKSAKWDELEFLTSLSRRPPHYVLSEAQEKWLRDICNRAGISW